MKQIFKVIDNAISDKHVKTYIKYGYKPRKDQSPITNIVVYDLETFNNIRGFPYCCCMYKLSKLSGIYHQDITEKANQKCLYDCVVLKRFDCVNDKLDHGFSFKAEPKNFKKRLLNIIYI